MKQTFVIEHDVPNPLTSLTVCEGVQECYNEKFKFTVTEITEQPEKCVWTDEATHVKTGCGFDSACSCFTDFVRCQIRVVKFCPYCGKTIEVVNK